MWRRFLSRDASRAWHVNKAATAVSPGESMSLYRVRFRPAKSRFRKNVGYATTAIICFYVWNHVAFWPTHRLDPSLLEEVDKDEVVEPWFIPLPFTEEKVQPPPYAGNGEEWQGFVAFSNDRSRIKSVKQELRLIVKKGMERHPAVKGNLKLGPSFLILTYPLRPPPEYKQWGIELNDDGIELKTRTVDSRTQALFDRIVKPYPMISGVYAFAKAMVKQNVDSVSKFFGYTTDKQGFTAASIDPELTKALKKLETRQAAHGGPGSGSGSDSRSPSTSESDGPSRTDAARTNDSKSTGDTSKSMNKDATPVYATLLGEASGPWRAFRENFSRAYKPLSSYPPRGSVRLHGIVSFDGPHARLYVAVAAWYHPKRREFHKESMSWRITAVVPDYQKPLRQ